MKICDYSDEKLVVETAKAIQNEKKTIHLVLLHLKEMDRRMLYLEYGFETLKDYCMEEFNHTAGEANYRISAMKFMRGSKKIERQIESGELPLTMAVVGWQHILKDDQSFSVKNKEEISSKIMGKTIQVARQLLQGKEMPKIKERTISPKIRVNINIQEKLSKLKALTGKNEIDLLDELLSDKINEIEQKRKNQASKPTKIQKSQSRYIQISVKAKLKIRATDQCENVNIQGEKCECRENLEIHHIQEYSKGGKNTEHNLKLLCRKHHRRESIKTFGVDQIERHANI